MRFTISCVLLATCLLGTASCVDSRPVHYYTLLTPPAPVPQGAPDGRTLLVSNVAVITELQDGRLRYRVGSNEVGAYQFHRWAERPGMMVSVSLMRALRTSGKYRSVEASGSSVIGDYLLHGKLYEFDEVDGLAIQTRISLHLALEDLKTRRDVWDHLLERTEPVTSKNVNGVVQSLDRNLQAVASQAAQEIDRVLCGQNKR